MMMNRPSEKLGNLSTNIKDDLENIRKELIESFFQTAITQTDIIIKRKLGILTEDLYDYYRYSKLILNEEIPKLIYDKEDTSLACSFLVEKLEHICRTCPLNFVSIDETKLTSSSWSHVYMCDICHCTRALEDNMIRHLETDRHCTASEYLADSATMIVQHCIRRNCVQLNRSHGIILDSMIVCPICYELFSNVNSCAMHSKLSHNLDYIYSVAFISRTFNLTLEYDEESQTFKHPEETEKILFLFLCPNLKCHYQTKHFSLFQTHLFVEHKHSFDSTMEIQVKELIKPNTYMHITRFLNENQRDINEELQTFEILENDMKYSFDGTNILNLIRKRSEFLKSFLLS